MGTCPVEHCEENMHYVHLRVCYIYRTHITYTLYLCLQIQNEDKGILTMPNYIQYLHMNWACAPLGIWVLAQVYLCVNHTLCTVRMCFLMNIAHAHVHCGSVLFLCLGCGFLLSIIIRVNIAPTC